MLAAALVTVGVASLSHVASAAPVAAPLAIKNAVPNSIEMVYRRGRGWGWGAGAGFAAGAIIGGALARPYYYGPGPYYYGPAYYGYPAPGYYAGPPAGDAVAYCMQRFRSYDPRSGTYLGYDGYRHPCP
jgi:hypothetical protein